MFKIDQFDIKRCYKIKNNNSIVGLIVCSLVIIDTATIIHAADTSLSGILSSDN